MSGITVASETILVLCEKAREKLRLRESGGTPSRVAIEMPRFQLSNVEASLAGLERMARSAIKLAGDGTTHVALTSEEFSKLAWALDPDFDR